LIFLKHRRIVAHPKHTRARICVTAGDEAMCVMGSSKIQNAESFLLISGAMASEMRDLPKK
jgi:hypothetical protein